VSTLEAAMDPLAEKEESLRTGLPPAGTLMDQAKAHAENLSRTADNLER